MTTVHITSRPMRRKPKAGDRKTIKGVEHIRCYEMVNIGTPWSPSYAYNRTGGRQHFEWVPAEEVNLITFTRKREKPAA